MNFFSKIITILIALSFLVFSANAKEIVIKFSHVTTENTPKGKGAVLLQKLVKERLGGKVRVEVFPSSQLYTDKAVLKALLLNDVQLAAPSLSKFGKFTKKLAIFDLPFLFKDTNSLECFTQSGKGKELLNSMNKKGIKGLGYWLNGMKQISANKPLITPSNAKGQKFRIMSSDVLEAQFKAIDANPQKMSFAEVYNSLATGVIDGQENTWSNIRSKKFHEVQSDFTVSNHGVLEYMLVTNKKFWEKLPSDIRNKLETIIDEVTQAVTKFALEAAEKDRQTVINSGNTNVHYISSKNRDEWVSAMKPVWSKFEDQVGKDNIDAVVACNK